MHRSLLLLVAPAAASALLFWLFFSGYPRGTLPAIAFAGSPNQDAPDRLHVVLVNGGGTARMNFQSHLLHLKQLRALLVASGVVADRVTVFNADGEGPDEDVALREGDVEGNFWRLRGTKAFGALRVPIFYRSSRIAGEELRPATQKEIGKWFENEGAKIRAGETLLLYVTDHGNKNDADLTDNTIRLWGKDEEGAAEALSVNELRNLLDRLDPGVRVVTLMSQCFSGSFANLMADGDGLPSGRLCGYFSATADRKAYGCYPRNMGVDNVGHSFRFINALAQSGSFLEAHDDILATDATPDVPLKTSDVFLGELLTDAAKDAGKGLEPFADELLAAAWKNKAAWEHEIRLLDKIGEAFGCFSPRSLAELDEQSEGLSVVGGQLENVSKAWKGALNESNRANFARFTDAQPDWNEQLAKVAKDNSEQGDARAMSKKLLVALEEFTREQVAVDERISTIYRNGEDAASLSYRMEVRLGVVLRMRSILVRVAGRQYISTKASDDERKAYEALLACEDLRIPADSESVTTLAEPKAFPEYEDDVEAATEALPAWMGVRFRDVEPALRDKLELENGAARILHVYPGSPADEAGLETGDIVTGPPGRPFGEPRRIRSWTMLSKIGDDSRLDVIRDEERLQVSLLPGEYPLEWPELPGPPKVGDVAPPLQLSAYRGDEDVVTDGGAKLLFFWATWCGPCKAAVHDLLEFESKVGKPVVAITDEVSEQLDDFFEDREGGFPATVARDPLRQTFIGYGVSGTPTFVYIDDDGRVASHTVGFNNEIKFGEIVAKLMSEADRIER